MDASDIFSAGGGEKDQDMRFTWWVKPYYAICRSYTVLKPDKKVIDLSSRRQQQQTTLEGLFSQYQTSLRTFMRLRLACPEDREDIVQELFYRLARVEGLEEKLNEHENPRAYLFSIANNLVTDYNRRQAVRQPWEHAHGEGTGEPVRGASPEDIVSSHQQMDQIKAVMKTLTPQCRAALVLKRFHQMTYQEVSAAMGISPSRVEKYIIRAMKALAEIRQGG